MDIWWEIFLMSGDPDAYVKFKRFQEEETDAADKNTGDCAESAEYGRS